MRRQDNDDVFIAKAIQRIYAAAGLLWPPAPGDRIVAMPLDRLIRANQNLEHIEIPELTPATAGAFLTSAGGRWPELLKDNTVLDGLLVANASGGYIFVRADADNPISRRRFTAAHELGHYLLHFLPSLEKRCDSDVYFVQSDSKETVQEGAEAGNDKVLSLPELERQANRFAAELLMPESICRAVSEQYAKRFSKAPRLLEHQLARDLIVSETAMSLRLRSLGLKP
jgi:hypothetical protein